MANLNKQLLISTMILLKRFAQKLSGPTIHSTVFMDISIGDDTPQRITIEFFNEVPKTAEYYCVIWVNVWIKYSIRIFSNIFLILLQCFIIEIMY